MQFNQNQEEMAREKSKQASLLILTLVAGLLSQSLVIPVISTPTLEDQKNYSYSPDPHAGGSPPSGSHHHTPSHDSGGSHGSPSHGSGGHGSSPPSNCGTPPSGGHYDPTPTTPTTPIGTPSTPSTPTYGSPPSIMSPPSSPSIDPGTPPSTSVPSPPSPFDPNSPPFPCIYWRSHPTLIWGLFGFYGTTLGGAFGLTSSGAPGAGPQLSLEQALSNTRTDGIGALYREGTASLLNSMVSKRFPFTTEQVRDRFVSSLGSNKATAAQARVFKMANEGQLKPMELVHN